jgi:MtaA/CmuA family methyltransferase
MTSAIISGMNSLERLQHCLAGEPVDRTPNFDIFMAKAAHSIGALLSDYYLDARILCEANLKVLSRFNLDIVQVISDPYREAADTGLEVEFPRDNLPLNRKPLINEPEVLSKLEFPAHSFGRRMTDRLEAVRLLHSQVGKAVPVMGWVEGALAEASDLRGMNNLMMDLVKRPTWVKELLEKCTEVAIAFACTQMEAGAKIIGLGDAVASQISPRMYREFALPYEQRIFQAVREKAGITRLHICGNTSHLLKEMAQSGAQIVDLDWMVDMHQAVADLGGLVVCGNLDPVSIILQGTPEQVRQGVTANAARAWPRWISAAGCEIPDQTPDENLDAQSEALLNLAGQAGGTPPRSDRERRHL